MPRIRDLAIAAALLGAGGLLFAMSGFYSVAATREHWPPVRWFFDMALARSVQFHAAGIVAPNLDDARLVRKGAAHYEGNCAPCHGAPEAWRNPFSHQMMPEPPHLASPERWSDAQLFWIVKNGIKYTGMPAWAAQSRDDEVWAMAAFLRRLPGLTGADYHKLAFGSALARDRSEDEAQGGEGREGEAIAQRGAPAATASCARCHGSGSVPADPAFPRLDMQHEAVLYKALMAYREGDRASGIMRPVAALLSPEEMRAVARYYAGLRPPAPAADPGGSADGEVIAREGTPQGVPGCAFCHDADAPGEARPALAGQHAAYIAEQIEVFRSGARAKGDGIVMTAIARLLTPEQVDAVSRYYAGQKPQPRREVESVSRTEDSRTEDAATLSGPELFIRNGCGACHRIRGLDARGEVGPDLTHVGGRQSIAGGLLPTNPGTLAAWIVASQHLKPGNKMPSFENLEGAELTTLATYLAGLK